jgi:hypothetical protein
VVHVPLWQVPLVQGVPSGFGGLLHIPVVESQVPASWHSSAMHSIGVPVQLPVVHESICVQGSLSSQLVPSGAAGFEHMPVVASHTPGL